MTKRCPRCNSTFDDQFEYCSADGARLAAEHLADVSPSPVRRALLEAGVRWLRRPGEFAVRFDSSDLRAILSRKLVVEEGTQGLVFHSGRMIGTLGPGLHTIESVGERFVNYVLGTPVQIVLVDVSDTTIPVDVPQCRAKDEQLVNGLVHLVLAVRSPIDFLLHVVKQQPIVSIQQVAQIVAPWVREIAEPIVQESRGDEFQGNPELRERLELDLRRGLDGRLQRMGLQLMAIDMARFVAKTDVLLRQRREDLQRETALQELDANFRKLQARLSRDLTQERRDHLKSEDEFKQFVQQLEQDEFRRDLLQDQERALLARGVRENKENLEHELQHKLVVVEQSRRDEITRLHHHSQMELLRETHAKEVLALQQRIELDDAQRAIELNRLAEDQAREIAKEEQLYQTLRQREREQFDWQTAQAQREYDERRRRAKVEFADALEQRDATVDFEAKMKDRERDRGHEDALRGVDLHHRYKRGMQELEEEANDKSHRREQEALDAATRRELARAEQLNQMNSDALIAFTPAANGGLLAELKKMELLKGMSEDQILALSAKDSPEVVRALAAKFSAAGDAQAQAKITALYERMLAERDRLLEKGEQGRSLPDPNAQAMLELLRETLRAQQQLGLAALQTQRDTAVEAAKHSTGGPSVVAIPTPVRSRVCSACGQPGGMQSLFCQHCGTPLPQA